MDNFGLEANFLRLEAGKLPMALSYEGCLESLAFDCDLWGFTCKKSDNQLLKCFSGFLSYSVALFFPILEFHGPITAWNCLMRSCDWSYH